MSERMLSPRWTFAVILTVVPLTTLPLIFEAHWRTMQKRAERKSEVLSERIRDVRVAKEERERLASEAIVREIKQKQAECRRINAVRNREFDQLHREMVEYLRKVEKDLVLDPVQQERKEIQRHLETDFERFPRPKP